MSPHLRHLRCGRGMPNIDSESQRRSMLNGQVLPNDVRDERVTAAIAGVPREAFVPKKLRGVAYLDEDIPCGNGRFLMEPRVFARLLQAAEIGPEDLVLDVACGPGYSTAVLAALAGSVVAVEADEATAAEANERLAGLGIDNAAVVAAPLADGIPDQGPFNVIMIEGSVEAIPDALTSQLAPGGRLVTVLRRGPTGKAVRVRALPGAPMTPIELFDAQVPLLPGFAIPRGFTF